MDNEPKLTTEQLKKLISDHSIRENIKSLLKQAQTVSELAGKVRKELARFSQSETETETIDQAQLLKDLEQLRIAKHLMRGIRFANFYQVLKGEEPRQATTEKFEAEKWLKQQAEKEARWKERSEKEKLSQVEKEVDGE